MLRQLASDVNLSEEEELRRLEGGRPGWSAGAAAAEWDAELDAELEIEAAMTQEEVRTFEDPDFRPSEEALGLAELGLDKGRSALWRRPEALCGQSQASPDPAFGSGFACRRGRSERLATLVFAGWQSRIRDGRVDGKHVSIPEWIL